jgi:hypothetical protein
VTGIDIAEGQIKYAQIVAETKGYKDETQLNFYVAQSHETKEKDHSVDLVTVVTAWPWFVRLFVCFLNVSLSFSVWISLTPCLVPGSLFSCLVLHLSLL